MFSEYRIASTDSVPIMIRGTSIFFDKVDVWFTHLNKNLLAFFKIEHFSPRFGIVGI